MFNGFEVGFRAVQIHRFNKKTAEVLQGDDLGGRAFALFLRPHPRAFAHFLKKNANARGLTRGGGWALLELTDALESEKPEHEATFWSEKKRIDWGNLCVNFLK